MKDGTRACVILLITLGHVLKEEGIFQLYDTMSKPEMLSILSPDCPVMLTSPSVRMIADHPNQDTPRAQDGDITMML